MAGTTTHTISGMQLSDGTQFNVAGLTYTSVTPKGNLEISTPKYGTIVSGKGGKMNFESDSNMAFKPGDAVQFQTQKYHNPSSPSAAQDYSEFRINVVNDGIDEDDNVQGMNINVAGLTLMTKNAQSHTYTDKDDPTKSYEGKWDDGKLPIMFKKKKDSWTKVNMHGKSFDIRTRTTGVGTGGGIALQIASCDSSRKENKLKIETDRKVAPSVGLPATDAEWGNYYQGEGGKGIEIGTLNSQFESFFTNELRRGADTSLFAVSRGNITLQDEKYDYPTQTDDSKDIKCDAQGSVKWVDLINAALYLKGQNLIPTDMRILNTWKITNTLTGATTSNAAFCVTKGGAYTATITVDSGKTLQSITVSMGGNDVTSTTVTGNNINIATVTGDVVVTVTTV